MYFAACVLVVNEKHEVLAVSRKDNPNDFGLPGGKVEPGEMPIEAAMRELYEETGYRLISEPKYQIIYHAEYDGKLVVTYQLALTSLQQVSPPKEKGVVAWVVPDILGDSKTFGEYNSNLFKTIGIKLRPKYNYGDPEIYSKMKGSPKV